MFENIKRKFWSRYAEQLMELERRRIKKQERQKKKHESLEAGTIEVYKSVLERRRYERETKKKD
jgi:hypothetical protein